MFTEAKYDPVDGLKNVDAFPQNPASEAAARAQFQDMFNQVSGLINSLIGELENTEENTSGAGKIGSAAISGVTGETVRAQLVSLKAQIDDFVGGSVSDGSITTAKLADEAVTIAKCAAEVFEGMVPADGSITTAKLADEAVVSAKIANEAITAAKVATLAITAAKIANGAVTAAKVAPGYVVGARFGRSATQSVPDETWTNVQWTTWPYDPDTSRDAGNPTRMVCKHAGVYTIHAAVFMQGVADGGVYQLNLKKNGTSFRGTRTSVEGTSLRECLECNIDLVELSVGDYIEVEVRHSTGAAKNIQNTEGTPILSMRRIVF